MSKAGPAKRKSHWKRFWIVFGVIVLINATLIALALNWVYGAVQDFELHAPQTTLSRYIDNLFSQEDAGTRAIQSASRFTPDENNTWEDYFDILRRRFAGAETGFTYRMTPFSNDEVLYGIYVGEHKLGEVILTPDESMDTGWTARSEVSYLPGYSIVAPSGIQVLYNGRPIPPESHVEVLPVRVEYYKGGSLTSVDMFSKMFDQSLAPVLYRYETGETLAEPTFSAASPLGEPSVSVDAEHRSVLVLPPLTAEQELLASQTMETVAKAYSDFITEDGTLANLLQYVYKETDLDGEFRGYQRGWYLDHEKREFSAFTFSSIAFHSDTCFTGHVDFDTYITFQGELNTFAASYDMAFMLLEERWQLVGIHARSENRADTA